MLGFRVWGSGGGAGFRIQAWTLSALSHNTLKEGGNKNGWKASGASRVYRG